MKKLDKLPKRECLYWYLAWGGQALIKEEYLLITTSKKDMGERIEMFTSNASFTSDMVENLPRKRGIIRKRK